MATIHVYAHSDRAVALVCDWAKNRQKEYYVAPHPTHAKAVADHVTINDLSEDQIQTLKNWLKHNGHASVRVEVES
jgi:hypothetical protein